MPVSSTPQQLADEAVAILESISDGFFSVNKNGQFAYVNRQAERILNVRREDILGRAMDDAYPGLLGTAFEAAYVKAIREKAPTEVTAHYPDHDKWYEVRISPVASGLSFYFRDVTATVKTEQALRESERNFRMLADSIPQIVWIVEASGRAVYFNRVWREYTGVPIDSSTPADVAGQFVHPDDGPVTMEAWRQAYEHGGSFRVEHRIRSKTGEYRWFLVLADPYRNEAGEIERWFGTSTDIHEQKLAKMALEAAERRHSFQLALADRIRPLSDPGEVTAAACELLGKYVGGKRVVYGEADDAITVLNLKRDWTDGSMMSMRDMQLTLNDFGAAVADMLRKGHNIVIDDITLYPPALPYLAAYTAAGVRSVLAIPLMKDGRMRAVLSVHDSDARHWAPEQIEMAEDMVDRTWSAVESARAQAELRAERDQSRQIIAERKAAEEKLRDADRRKDEFLAMLAHELRNPLAPIGAAAHILRMGRLDEGRVRHTSQIIGRQVDHMTHLINDLLDVSRVTRGLVELDNAPLDIGDVVLEAIEQVAPLMQAKRHHLHSQVPPETTMVMGDKKRLVQVIANILNNAAKYTPEGGAITLDSQVRPDHVRIEVIDNGIGMTPDLAAHAFELFAQAERSSDRSAGGLGLGLALVKSLVELHGGSVTCDSAGPGQGSRFSVFLPRLASAEAPGALRAEAEEAQPAGSALHVLVVDDNADAAAMLAMVLENLGHRVTVEQSSRAALERARRDPPDVCVLDIGLPEIDGNELAQRLHAQPETADAILIAVTGYGHDSDRRQSLAAGFAHHLVKPADTQRLASILAEVSRRAPSVRVKSL
jgi:PAS domain S-box-containing protein